MNGMLTNTNK